MASFPVGHPRTLCVYCGTRIPGRLRINEHAGTSAERKRERKAARLACPKHRGLVHLDPFYSCPDQWQAA